MNRRRRGEWIWFALVVGYVGVGLASIVPGGELVRHEALALAVAFVGAWVLAVAWLS